jgi:tRNA(fMet)-specific endonuclease VapC
LLALLGAFKSKDPSKNLASAKGFLSTIDVLELDDHSALRAGETMAKLESKGNMIDPRDLFSGCIALENGYAVLTGNRRHFERIPDLLVLEPSDIT